MSGEFQWRSTSGPTKTEKIPSGLYSFGMLSEHLSDNITGLSLDVNKATGYVGIVVPQGTEVNFGDNLRHLLGLDDEGWLTAGKYIGDRPVDFMPQKALYIHLDQLSTTNNVMDGAPSTLLGIVPIGLDTFGTSTFSNPEFKQLKSGAISELTVHILDRKGTIVNNHNLPVVATLEIK